MRCALILQFGRCGWGLSGAPAWALRLGLVQFALVPADVLAEIRAPGSNLGEWIAMRDALAGAKAALKRAKARPFL